MIHRETHLGTVLLYIRPRGRGAVFFLSMFWVIIYIMKIDGLNKYEFVVVPRV
jgi:hypothetical protein